MTELQYHNLVGDVYSLLISNPFLGMGDIGEVYNTAKETIDEWIHDNNIKVI